MPDKISPSQFAKSVKEKYPEYKSYDDVKLSQAIVDKYPEYKDIVDFGVQPSIQEPVQPIVPSSKYQKSVDDDRSEIGKTIATLYNGIVGSLERFAGGGAEMFAKVAASIPTPQYNVSGGYMPETKKPVGIAELPKEQQIEARKQLRAKVEKTFEPLKSRYVSKEEEKAIQGKFDVTNGIGLDDLQGLVAMSGGMAIDMGLGYLTGGTSFVVQGYDDAVKDYDEAAKKMGVQENDNARMLYGIAGGTINGLLEKFAIDKLVGSGPVFKSIQKKAIANVLKNTANVTGKRAVDAIEEAAQAEIKRLTSDLRSRGMRAGYRAMVEGGTEVVQSALEDGAKFAINNVQGNEVFNEQEIKDGFFQNLINSGVAGAIYGPVMGYGADKVFGRNINTEVLQDVANAKTDEDLAVINDELSKTFDDNNFSEAERQSVLDNVKRYNQIKQTLPIGTSPAVQVVAIPLIENRIKIDDEINKRKQELEKIDESLRPDEMASISLLEDKRAQINDDIKETVSGDSFNYFEKNGKFFKQLGENTPEEISKNRYDLQLLKQEDNATTTGQGPIQEGATEGDISQRTGIESQQEQEAAKADIGYSYIVSEEGEEVPVAALVNKKVRVNGKPAILYREGQRIVARVIGTNQILDTFGNVNEMMSAAPSDFGIEVDDTIVTETPTGYKVEGQDMVNDNENPIDAISTDPSGNVMNVTLKTPAGKRRKFRGQAAQDLAYQITLKETLKNEDEFESFLEKEHQAELDAAEAKATAEAETARANEQVPIGKVATEPAIGRFTADNINDVDNIPGNKIQKKVIADIKNVVNSIKGLLPISVNIHNQDTFSKAVLEAGGTQEDSISRGFYMSSDGSIHLNMDTVTSDTMLHEGFHPILDLLEKNNPEVINQFFAELESIPEAASIIASAKENYTGDVTQKKEAITDFVAGVADGRVVLNPTNFQKIKAFIVNMLNKIGIGQGQVLMNVQNEQDLIKLAKFVTEKFTTGEQVTKQELGIAEEAVVPKGKTQLQGAPTKPVTKKRFGPTIKTFKEQFRYGLLGKEEVKLKEKMSGELSAELSKAERLVKDASDVIKKYGKSVSQQDVVDFMTGKPVSGNIPLDLADKLTEMRSHIDMMTDRLIQLGVIDNPESIAYYKENKGKYILRSYESINYKDGFLSKNIYGQGLNIDNVAKKLSNVDKTTVDAALKHLADIAKAENPSLSNEEALKKAREDANSILSSSESYIMQKGLTGSVNVNSLSQRKDLSPEVRALMGEYTDPLYNYYSTIFKISSLNASRQYINSLKEYGLGKFFFDKKTEDATEQMAGEESKALAPLNGLYTFPEIKEALQTSQKEENTFRSAFLGRIRKFKTVYNPATHVKNLIGNMGFAISNGHWNYMGDSYKYIKAQITGASDKDTIRMMDTLNRYGVLNNVVGLGELKTYFEKHESVDDFLEAIYNNANKNTTAEKLGKLKANLNIIPKSIEKAYAIEDDIFKILGFVNEANRYAVAMYSKKYNKLTENEKQKIDGIVAEIVKDTYPTFSRVPKVVKTISKAMFIGNFLAFPVESVRVQYNSLALAKKEIQSGNKKLAIVGATRLAGFLGYNSLFSSLVYYGYSLAGAGLTGMPGMISGDDEKKETTAKSISRYLASYLKNTDVYVSDFSNGKLVYYDIGSLDSYSYQKKVWNSFWSTANKEGFYKSIAPTIATVLDPWMQFDFAVDNIIKLSKNDNGQGFKIYNPEAKPMDIYKDISSFVGKQFLPGAIGSAIKIVDSYQQGDYEKMKDEFQSQIFARKYSVDLKKQFASYVYAESGNQNKEIGFKDRLSDAQKIYTDAKRKNKTGVELAEKYRESIDAYKNVLQTARDYYLSAIDGGASIKELNKILTKSRIGASESRTIRTGHFSSFERGYVRP